MNWLYRHFFKRFFDIVLSLTALIVLSPILLLITILGVIKMKGNPFFLQSRHGKNEKIFRLMKFRTMTCEKDKDGNDLPDDMRLTKYGRMLRSTSLDELPELFNILFGQMAIVGPRPQLVRDMVFMTPEQRKRHSVRQGLTGLAQISGRNNISWEDKFNYDLQYIKHITFWGDIKIILVTALKVFKREDVVREGTMSDMDLGDWLLAEGKISQYEYDQKLIAAKKYM
jgi:lipopolysaccharide/colanic/teichoic acid biosynthesis glycosyltransferase